MDKKIGYSLRQNMEEMKWREQQKRLYFLKNRRTSDRVIVQCDLKCALSVFYALDTNCVAIFIEEEKEGKTERFHRGLS